MSEIRQIATIYTDFKEKFGIPRQSGVVSNLFGEIVMCPEYSVPEAFRGLEEFSHLWLLWEFSESVRDSWSPTVRPPRLGGNKRMGVFATRSPFRPNPIGLSCVKLEKIDLYGKEGVTLLVSGVDMLDGTPIFDIKPYLPYADSYQEACGGFADQTKGGFLEIANAQEWEGILPSRKWDALMDVLRQDPRPSYQNDPERVYGMKFAGIEVHFQVDGRNLTVCSMDRIMEKGN